MSWLISVPFLLAQATHITKSRGVWCLSNTSEIWGKGIGDLCFCERLFVFLDFTCSSMAEKPTEGAAVFSALLKGPDSRLLNTRTTGYYNCHIVRSMFLSDPRELGMIFSLKCHSHRAEEKSNDSGPAWCRPGVNSVLWYVLPAQVWAKYLFLQDVFWW